MPAITVNEKQQHALPENSRPNVGHLRTRVKMGQDVKTQTAIYLVWYVGSVFDMLINSHQFTSFERSRVHRDLLFET